MAKIIVAGSRSFSNFSLLCDRLDFYLQAIDEPIEIVSGTAAGADRLGEEYAKLRGYFVKQFPADWDRHGKRAGYLRNKEMAEYASHCVVFWDGQSKGTKLMIELAQQHGLKVRVVKFNARLGL